MYLRHNLLQKFFNSKNNITFVSPIEFLTVLFLLSSSNIRFSIKPANPQLIY